MHDEIAEHITNLPLFAGYTRHGARELIRLGEVKRFEVGARLFSQGEPASFAGLLLEGRAVVLASKAGKDFELGELSAGSIFGEIGVLCRLPRSASLVTRAPSSVLLWEAGVFRRALLTDTYFSERIFRQAFRTILEHERRLIERIDP